MRFNDTKCLIAYFSRKGNNYVSGQIVNLPAGNTEVAAEMIIAIFMAIAKGLSTARRALREPSWRAYLVRMGE